jgi:hypothetical protein
MVDLECGPPQIQGCARLQQTVMMGLGEGKTFEKKLPRLDELPLFAG